MGRSTLGVIFDLEGTLIYRGWEPEPELEREKCAAVAAFAARELGCRDPDTLAERLLGFRLEGWRSIDEDKVERLAVDAVKKAFSSAGLPTDEAILSRAERMLFEPEVRQSRLYPGARDMLETLRGEGLRLGMISNFPSHQVVLDVTRKLEIEGYFDPLVTSAGFGKIKPHPSIFAHVLDAWSIPAASAVMVGDTLSADVLGAHAVGMRAILVQVEPNPINERLSPSVRPWQKVSDLGEIPPLIRQ